MGGERLLNQLELPLAILLNALAGRHQLIDLTIIYLNSFGGEALFVIISLLAYLWFASKYLTEKDRWLKILLFAVFIFTIWLVTDRISNRVEYLFNRNSPSYYMGESLVNLQSMYPERNVKVFARSSFPSNHGNVFFILFFACLYRWGQKALWLGILAFILSLPRIFTGAHWITDTLIGSVLLSWMAAAVFFATPLFTLYLRNEYRVSVKILLLVEKLYRYFFALQ